jgi:hypothetical protein
LRPSVGRSRSVSPEKRRELEAAAAEATVKPIEETIRDLQNLVRTLESSNPRPSLAKR